MYFFLTPLTASDAAGPEACIPCRGQLPPVLRFLSPGPEPLEDLAAGKVFYPFAQGMRESGELVHGSWDCKKDHALWLCWGSGLDGEVLKVLAVLWENNSCLLLLTIGRETEAQQKKEGATWGYPGRRKLSSTRVKFYVLLIQYSRHPASQLLLLSFPIPSQGQGGSQLCPISLQFSWLSSSLERFWVALHTAVLTLP